MLGHALFASPLRMPALILGAIVAAAMPAQAEYRIGQGETLRIDIFRVPEMTRELVVDIDGRIAFPPLGQVEVSGMTAPEVAADIERRLAGLEIMLDAQVTVGVIAVRPVVVGGDVGSPGAVPYEGGMTVRHAIALAGGLGTLRPQIDEVIRLRGERDAVAAELRDRQAVLARAEAQLNGDATPVLPDVRGLGGTGSEQVLASVQAQLVAAREEDEAQRAYLQRDLGIVTERIEQLVQQGRHEQALVDQQSAEVARYVDMQDRGLTPQTRVSEEYRTLDTLRGNRAETAAHIADVRRQREAVLHEIDRFDARREAALREEIRETQASVAVLRARFEGIRAQLAQMGNAGRDIAQVTLYPAGGGAREPVAAEMDRPLRPGDMIEVNLPDALAPLIPISGVGASQQAAGRVQGTE
ncbi:polysaccharide biosynthesis/export family protein [Paracoccus sp. 1_MG-2023]|uniref:polysaccharide biosynthesis/export family protein n=1 Tax=unclassified Paracoccus (in: a-proteobacteria) TaxID=2688777 RepID=UPI001C080560|nr:MULTISPECIES: polysaccharide biosynthesis/export family protein [unclassified Paracoccus (in: a-proteobacteria)]MBU2957922.1 polysaccharide biosynthesis/export family protein [Paracoccus sp. C2R09]MDO6668885.1 polysaccharide biosynthesis/export family protein [Paracoccus sp. 1_MG-2023]